MISACARVETFAPGDFDEAAQPVGMREQTADVDRCLLGRIVPRCLKTHRGTSIPGGRSSSDSGASTTSRETVLRIVIKGLPPAGPSRSASGTTAQLAMFRRGHFR
jgi:hypothetical protein